MITNQERNIISALNAISFSDNKQTKLHFYKLINLNLRESPDFESTNINVNNFSVQFIYDISNYYTLCIGIEIFMCIELFTRKIVKRIISFKSNTKLNTVVKKLIEKFTSEDLNESFEDKEFIEIYVNLFNNKKMNTELILNAVDGIYKSAENIFQQKQKSLYGNILTLLTKILKANEPSETNKMTNEQLEVWLVHVLPLLFTNDINTQKIAISAVETLIKYLKLFNYREYPKWNIVKGEIIDNYSKNLNELRELQNDNWYKLWLLLIQIIDKEIIKGANIINKFLSIVEQGFRSSDLKTRAQSFICWKGLIATFSDHNEMIAPKRIKLICIPLKSAKSKTIEIAVNKFEAWWFLIQKLQSIITENIESVLEQFLKFCFGPFGSVPLCSYLEKDKHSHFPGKLFLTGQPKTILSLIYLLTKPSENIQSIADKCEFVGLAEPIDFRDIFKTVGNLLINSCGEATILMRFCNNVNHNELCINLWKGLLEQAKHNNTFEHFELIMKNLDAIIHYCKAIDNKESSKLIPIILELVSKSEIYPFKKINYFYQYECVLQGLKHITTILLDDYIDFTENIDKIIRNMYTDINRYRHQHLIIDLVYYFTIVCDEYKSETQIIIKLKIWKKLFSSIDLRLKEIKDDKDKEDCFQMVVNFLNWPLKNIELISDESILNKWKHLYEISNSLSKSNDFGHRICKSLKKIMSLTTSKDSFEKLINYFIIILKHQRVDGNNEGFVNLLEILEIVFQFFVSDDIIKDDDELKTILRSLIIFINLIELKQILFLLSELKSPLKLINDIYIKRKNCCALIDELKNIICNKISNTNLNITSKDDLEKYRTDINEILDICKESLPKINKKLDDEFVRIPTTWKFRPDKLTEHQIEKLKERKTDIPALYNDTSQSQESRSLSSWTPKEVNSVIDIVSSVSDTDLSTNIDKNNKIDSQILTNNLNNQTVLKEKSNECKNIETELIKNTLNVNANNKAKPVNDIGKTSKLEYELRKLETSDSFKLDKNERFKRSAHKLVDNNSNKRRTRQSLNAKNEHIKTKKVNNKKQDKEAVSLNKDKEAVSLNKDKEAVSLNKDKEAVSLNKDNTSNLTKEKTRTNIIPVDADNIMVWINEADSFTANNLKDNSTEIIESSQVNPDPILRRASLASKKIITSVDPEKEIIGNNKATDAEKKLDDMIFKEMEGEKQTEKLLKSVLASKVQIRRSSLLKEKKLDNIIDKKPSTETQSLDTDTLNTLNNLNKKQTGNIDETSETLPLPPPLEEIQISKDYILRPEYRAILESPKKLVIRLCNEKITSDNYIIPAAGKDKEIVEKTSHQETPNNELETQLNIELGPILNVTLETQVNTEPIENPPTNCIPDKQEITNNVNIETEQDTNKSNALNSSILSSPQGSNLEERNNELMNCTIDLSPIPIDKESYQFKTKIISDTISDKYIQSPSERKKKLPSIATSNESPQNSRVGGLFTSSPCSANKQKIQTNRGKQLMELFLKKQSESPCQARTNSSEQNNKDTGIIDLLTFSKKLPSPNASPSISILKRRRLLEESKSAVESPPLKKKRVSFHYPVSATKQYVLYKDEDEKVKHCLDELATPLNNNNDPNLNSHKFSIKRAKSEHKLTNDEKLTNDDTSLVMDPLIVNNTNSFNAVGGNKVEDDINIDNVGEIDIDEISLTPSPKITFSNESEIIQYILGKYQLDEIIEKYQESDYTFTSKSVNFLTKQLTNIMSEESKTKTVILEQISEKFPEEFLDHALQENSNKNVCDLLSIHNLMDFITEKAKIDNAIKLNLVEKVSTLFELNKQNDNLEILSDDIHKILITLLKNKMSNEQILSCLDVIFEQRRQK